MKLLVCISKTPDTTAKIAFVNDGKDFDQNGIQYILNPYDEWYALVKAIELKEKLGGTVTVINIGDASNDMIIRKALAIGADDAIRVDVNPTSSVQTANEIAVHAKDFDIILLGKETIDYNGSEVGAMVAELLDLPYVSYINKMDIEGNEIFISREIEGGNEQVSVSGKIVVSAAKGLAEQRIPNMQGIMKAKSKPLNVVPSVFTDTSITTVSHTTPIAKSGVKMVNANDMDELVKLLHEEAKAI
jgi:electron transfer flavoprotein beta subunit